MEPPERRRSRRRTQQQGAQDQPRELSEAQQVPILERPADDYVPDEKHSLATIAGAVSDVRDRGLSVRLNRTTLSATPELLTWQVIQTSTDRLGFGNYQAFMD